MNHLIENLSHMKHSFKKNLGLLNKHEANLFFELNYSFTYKY